MANNQNRNRSLTVLALLVLLLCIGTVLTVRSIKGGTAKANGPSAQVKELHDKLSWDKMGKMSREERSELFKKVKALPEDQKVEMEKLRFLDEVKRAEKSLSLSPDQLQAQVNKEATHQLEWETRMQERRAEREKEKAAQGGDPKDPNGQRPPRNKGGDAANGSGGRGGPGGGGPGGMGGRGNHMKQMIASIPPEQRATVTEYKRMVNMAKQQLQQQQGSTPPASK